MITNDKEASTSDAAGGKIHTVQPLRDLVSNWEVDLAKNLEEYLLKICSGEITGGEDNGPLSVNFAEAALLLQGSIQVYSRKVEYLYSLVLQTLEFISQKSQQNDQPENSSGQEEQNGPVSAPKRDQGGESDDSFWCSDDIPVDPKNSLDDSNDKDTLSNRFVKPPANLVVLEGDCLDSSGDCGELASYLLATNDLYRDFILLDACDATTVDEFLGEDGTVHKTKSDFKGGSSNASKSRKSFLSPSKRSGGSGHKPSAGKMDGSDRVDRHNETNDHNNNMHTDVNMDHDFEMDDGYSQPGAFDDSDEDSDDPWKPLNPHERGNLKVKPFKKVKGYRKCWNNRTAKISITEEFPLAKLHGPVSAELHEMWEAKHNVYGKDQEAQSPPYYEKLRQSLVLGYHENGNAFNNDIYDDDGENRDDSGLPDFDMPEDGFMNEDHFNPEKHTDEGTHFDMNEAFEHEDANPHVNLEDLCRSHLDSLLASIAETEKQTALAARVSTWKQRIEQNLDEQDSRPPFDIHEYGQLTLDKLSLEADVGNSFTDIVYGQQKHDVARTFSALLQLVNNGNVELERGGINGDSVCYTAENPFHVRLLSNEKGAEVQLRSSNKRRAKGQIKRGKENQVGAMGSSPGSVKVAKLVGIRCTPESKRRRRSRLVGPDGLNSTETDVVSK